MLVAFVSCQVFDEYERQILESISQVEAPPPKVDDQSSDVNDTLNNRMNGKPKF
jgi:hypothetical protein